MGRDVAEPLRRGGLHCAFHARPFCTKPAEEFTGAAIVLLLDLETSGLDVTRDLVVEIAATVAPADPAALGACFSTVVSGAQTSANEQESAKSELFMDLATLAMPFPPCLSGKRQSL